MCNDNGVLGQSPRCAFGFAAKAGEHLVFNVAQVGDPISEIGVVELPERIDLSGDGVAPSEASALVLGDEALGGAGQLRVIEQSGVCDHDGALARIAANPLNSRPDRVAGAAERLALKVGAAPCF